MGSALTKKKKKQDNADDSSNINKMISFTLRDYAFVFALILYFYYLDFLIAHIYLIITTIPNKLFCIHKVI